MKFEKRENANEFVIKMLRADALPDEQADRIADAPHLLKSIRARIAAEKSAKAESADRIAESKTTSGFWQAAFALKSQFAIGFAAAVVLVVLIWRFAIPVSHNQKRENVAANNRADSVAANGDLQNQTTKSNDFATNEQTSQPTIERVSSSPKTIKQPRAAIRTNAARTIKVNQQFAVARAKQSERRETKSQNPREFYQLAFAGELDANETKQIVRVKLSPDALGALGVSVPIVAQTNKIVTADLLLGEDGVPRAIRFVK